MTILSTPNELEKIFNFKPTTKPILGKSPIRVAMVIQAYLPHVGGAEKQIASLAPLLQAQGVDVHVITRQYAGLARYEEIGGVPVHRLPIPGPKPVASLSFSLNAIPLLKKLKPDLIHAHELLSPTTTAVLAKRMLGTPVVAKVLRGGVLGDISKLKRRAFGMTRFSMFKDRVSAFITISKEIDAELSGLGVSKAQRPFIPNGVDTNRFMPLRPEVKRALRADLGLPQGCLAVFTGRLAVEKRVDQLIAIWRDVRSTHGDAHLVLLGSGPEEDRLNALATEGVHFLGRVDNVAPYLQSADLFVLPSATEGLSNALLEGMATGLPVVATAVGGAPDVVEDDFSGFLIPPDDPEALSRAIIRMFDNRDEMRQMGEHGRERICREYALESVARRLRELYDRVITQSEPVLQNG